MNNTTYMYDAEGRRINKNMAGASLDYLFDPAGRQIAEVGAGGVWDREEIYVGGRHLATYTGSTTYFHNSDWLGTERVRTNVSGNISETCQSLPFGDGQACNGGDFSPVHFTAKQRDTESNLDDFGARYYSSTQGRWISADWSARPDAVPYADLRNPQSLDLYAYVWNSPATGVDPSGHEPPVGSSNSDSTQSGTGGDQTVAAQPAAQSNGTERITMGIEAAANLYVAEDKAEIALGLALSTPESGPAATATGTGAALASISALSSALTGTAQLVGAITGKTEEADKVADGLAASTSVMGLITTVATNGDVKKAAAAASIEGIATSSFKREIFKSGASIAEAAVSIIDLVSAPPAPPRPPVPGPPPTQ